MTEAAVAKKREPQVAVVPLNTLDVQDVGRGAARFDAWLRSISGDVVTLDRIKGVAGSLPVVGNIMALVDALGDIVTLTKSKQRELLDWVSLGINLIGVLPAPPTMAAARMSLRPTLFLVRQELRNSAKMLLGDSMIEVLVGHLNATIVGTIDDFVKQAQGKLSGILADAGKLGESAVTEIAKGLEAVVNGKLDSKGDARAAGQKITAAGNQLLSDPKAAISNIFGAAFSAYKAVGKGVANSAARNLLPDQAKKLVMTHTGTLRAMGPEIKTQLSKLGDPGTRHSIGWLLQMLSGAVVTWRKRRGHGQSASVKPNATSKAQNKAGEGRLEASSRQAPANANANGQKNGACAGTCNSISFALGSESLSHTDFSLPGPFPIEWVRTYSSRFDAFDNGELGARWVTEFTTRFDCKGDGLIFLEPMVVASISLCPR